MIRKDSSESSRIQLQITAGLRVANSKNLRDGSFEGLCSLCCLEGCGTLHRRLAGLTGSGRSRLFVGHCGEWAKLIV